MLTSECFLMCISKQITIKKLIKWLFKEHSILQKLHSVICSYYVCIFIYKGQNASLISLGQRSSFYLQWKQQKTYVRYERKIKICIDKVIAVILDTTSSVVLSGLAWWCVVVCVVWCECPTCGFSSFTQCCSFTSPFLSSSCKKYSRTHNRLLKERVNEKLDRRF